MNYFKILLYSILLILYSCNPDEDISGNDDIPDTGESLSYSLLDINSSSETYNQNIGPASFDNMITVHYFGHQN